MGLVGKDERKEVEILLDNMNYWWNNVKKVKRNWRNWEIVMIIKVRSGKKNLKVFVLQLKALLLCSEKN